MKKLTTVLLSLVAALVLTSTAMATSPLLPSMKAGGLATMDPDNPALIATNVHSSGTLIMVITPRYGWGEVVAIVELTR